MEPKFQTSFIPKKMPMIGGATPAAPKKAPAASLFMMLAGIIFVLSLVAAAGSYVYRANLISNEVVLKKQLSERENQFNISLIEQLKSTNIKIDNAQKLLANHVAYSQIFAIISQMTSENVRFMSMDVSAGGDAGDGVKISMRGYGTSFTAVAFQSDVLGRLQQYGLGNIIKNPILSDPSLDSGGTVSFGFTATIRPDTLLYSKTFASTEATSTKAAP